jgi:hypothetical protein
VKNHFATAPYTLRTATGEVLDSYDTLESAIAAGYAAAANRACDIGVMGVKTVLGHLVPSCVHIVQRPTSG